MNTFLSRFHSLHELDESEGTSQLVDASHRLKTKGNSDILLIPQPSNDINDPLNWPQWKKGLAFITILIFLFLTVWVLAGIGAAVVLILNDFKVDLTEVVRGLVSWMVLTIGLANFFWIPFGMYFGRRPAFLIASFLLFATTVWQAATHNWHSMVAARILGGFAAAAGEALGAAICADLFFLHERGRWMGLYTASAGLGGNIGGLLSGFIIDAGWRWHFWVGSITTGLNALSIFLFFPETQYFKRDTIKEAVSSHTSQDKNGSTSEVVEDSGPPKKTFLQELKPWSPINGQANPVELFLRPWPMILYPATMFGFLSYSASLAWLLCVINTNASIFQAPPYNFSTGINGLINIPGTIGVIAGSFCGGALTDKFAEWMARRNNGVYEPEARLIPLVIPFFVVPIGLLMYGIGVEHQTHWIVIYIGYGFVNFAIACVPAIVMTYIIDAYYQVAFEALLLVNGLKQVFSFGFSYAIIPWLIKDGYQKAFGAMIGINCAVLLLAVPLWYYGKYLRHRSASWKIIYRKTL